MTTVLEPAKNGQYVEAPRDSSTLYFLGGLSVVAAIMLGIAGSPALAVVAAVGFVLLLAARRWLLDPQAVYFLAIGAVFFFPANRYVLPVELPMDLEPYRVAVGLAFAVWGVALLIDPGAKPRGSFLDYALVLIFVSMVASIVGNPSRSMLFGDGVTKALIFVVSYFGIFFLTRSLFATREKLDLLIRVIVACGTVVAAFAIVESVSGFNFFARFGMIPGVTFVPFVKGDEVIVRGGAFRAFSSGEHPIALGAALVMLLPLALYVASRRRRWLFAPAVILLGVLASVSRTPIVMLGVVTLVFLAARPRQTLQLAPYIAGIFIAASMLVPSASTAAIRSFFPEGGLFAEQSNAVEEGSITNGRLSDLGPALHEWSKDWAVGAGFGTRRIDGLEQQLADGRYSGVLDNQWLDFLLTTGLVGVIAWIWLFVRTFRHLRPISRSRSPDSLLAVGLTASFVSFVLGMYFFDALAFAQVMFVFFLELAIAAILVGIRREEAEALGRQA
jgi:hypothetical protein